MRKNVLTLTLCATLLVVPVQEARAQFVVSDPSVETSNWMIQAKQVMQYIQEAQTALQTLQTAQLMTRAGVNLIKHPSTNIAQDIGQFTSILAASQGIARNMAALDTNFQMQFGSFTPSPVLSWANQYNNWATSVMKTVSGSLGAAGYQGNALANDQLFLAQVQMMSQAPQGQMEALQLGNTIGAATVAQLMNLRALMVADMSAKAAFTGQQVQAQQSAQNTQASEFAHANWTADQRIW